MENIKEQFASLYMELDLTDDQAAMINKLQRDVDAALRQPPVSGSLQKLPPKEWFENVLIGKEVVWGTNSFSDIAAIKLIEKYVEYLKQ